MNQDAINEAQERLDKLRRQADRATQGVRREVIQDELAARAAYDIAHPPLEQAKLALAANDAEVERLRGEGVSDDVLAAMLVDSAQLRAFIESAPVPMAPEAVAEIARRTAEIDAAVFDAMKSAGLETTSRIAVNQWVEANPDRTSEVFTPAIVAMMQSLGEYTREVTPAPRQTEVRPALRRVQGPIDPATGEHTYTIEVARELPLARIGGSRARYLNVISRLNEYVDDHAEMLMDPADEEVETEAPAAKQMRIEP